MRFTIIATTLLLQTLAMGATVTIPCPAGALSYPGSYCVQETTSHSYGGVKKWITGSTRLGKKYTVWAGHAGSRTQNIVQVIPNYGGGSNTGRLYLSTKTSSSQVWFPYYKAVDAPGADKSKPAYVMRIYHASFADGKDFLGRMDKPIVICQGFDPNYGIVKKGSLMNMDAQKMESVLGLEHIKTMIENGYSVVIINFQDPTMSIDHNAYAALDALQWTQSQAGMQKDMVVIGPSMGGLIMRKALLLAAEKNANIRPRLFIAYDSPNWGAVIPAAIQAAVHFNRGEGSNERRSYNNLTSPAASQMLLYQIKGLTTISEGYLAKNDGTVLASTMSEYLRSLNSTTNWQKLRSLKSSSGTPIQLVAVTDGAPDKRQGLPVNTKYCDYDYWTLDWEMATTNPGVKKRIAWFDPANMWERYYYFQEPVFTENLPGGLRDSYTSVKAALRQEDFKGGGWDPGSSPFLDVGTWGTNKKTGDVEMQNITQYKGHAFIPTASAAGIRVSSYAAFNQESTWLLSAGTTQLDNSQSLFDRVYLAQNNWNHVSPADEQPASPVHGDIFNIILEKK